MKRFSLFAAALASVACLGFMGQRPAAAADKGWGTVKGQVVFDGTPPARNPIGAVNANQDKAHCLSKGALLEEKWVVNKKNNGVRWLFVWLTDANGKSPTPVHESLKEPKDKEVSLDQPCCQFVPHVLAMRQGQDLVVKNSAPVPHNVKWQGNPLKNPGGNVIVPPGKSYTINGLKADRLPLTLNCNIHPWMEGRLAVFDHPYFAVTDADGNFEIKLAPAGDYKLMVWHEAVGWGVGRTGKPITIKKDGVTDVGEIKLAPKE